MTQWCIAIPVIPFSVTSRRPLPVAGGHTDGEGLAHVEAVHTYSVKYRKIFPSCCCEIRDYDRMPTGAAVPVPQTAERLLASSASIASAHEPAMLQDPSTTSPAPSVWHGTRVALVLRGQAYRGSHNDKRHYSRKLVTSCNATYWRLQEHAWSTLRAHVVWPVEAAGGTVDVIATECSSATGCHLVEEALPRLLGARVVALQTRCDTANQGENMRATLETFRSHAGESITSRYDWILITRHDLNWVHNITQWPAPQLLDRFHYLGRCMMRCGHPSPENHDVTSDRGTCHAVLGGPPSACVLDTLHSFPARLFTIFEARIVGTPGCFGTVDSYEQHKGDSRQPHTPMTAGHMCFNVTASFLPEPAGFILDGWPWRPKHMTREPSPLCSFVRLHSSHLGESRA